MAEAAKKPDETPAARPARLTPSRCLMLALLAALLLALLVAAWWRSAAPAPATATVGGRGGRAWGARGGCNCVAPPS